MTDPQKHDGITASLNARIARLEERNEEKTSELGRLQDELRRERARADEAELEVERHKHAADVVNRARLDTEEERDVLREECERLRGALEYAYQYVPTDKDGRSQRIDAALAPRAPKEAAPSEPAAKCICGLAAAENRTCEVHPRYGYPPAPSPATPPPSATPPRDEPPPARDESAWCPNLPGVEAIQALLPSQEASDIADAVEAWVRLGASNPATWANRIRSGDYQRAERSPAPAGRTAELERVETLAAKVWNLRSLLARCVKYAREDRMVTPGATRLARALDEAERLLAKAPDPGPEPAELPDDYRVGTTSISRGHARIADMIGDRLHALTGEPIPIACLRALLREPAPAAELPPLGEAVDALVARYGRRMTGYSTSPLPDLQAEWLKAIGGEGLPPGWRANGPSFDEWYAAHHLGREPAKGG